MSNQQITHWIFPGNPKYYKIEEAFKDLKILDWKQSNKSVKAGDIVFIYVSGTNGRIAIKCEVLKSNKTKVTIDDAKYFIDPSHYASYPLHMELKIIGYNETLRPNITDLNNNNVKGNIMGPRRITDAKVIDFLNSFFK